MPIYKQNIDEARAINGRVYKDYVKDVEDQINSGSETFSLHYNTNKKVATTSTGRGGVLDSVAQNHIEKIDLEKEKAILESTDIIDEYDAYIEGHFLSILERGSHREKGQLEQRMLDQYNGLKKYFGNVVSEKKIATMVINNFYGLDELQDKLRNMNPTPSDSEIEQEIKKFIKSILQLRINYVNKITSLLARMLKINYKELGLTEQQCKIYIDSLQSGNNASVKAAGELKQIIRDNSDKYAINGGEGFDFRPLGFGCIFGTSEDLGTVGSDSNKDAMLDLLQKVIRYDAVVLAHGGSRNIKYSPYDDSKIENINNLVSDMVKNMTLTRKQAFKILNRDLYEKADFYEYEDACEACIDTSSIDRLCTKIVAELKNNNSKLITDILNEDPHYASNKVMALMDSHLKEIRIIPFKETYLYKKYIEKSLDNDDERDTLTKSADALMQNKDIIKTQAYPRIYPAIFDTFNWYNRTYSTVTDSEQWSCTPTRTLNGGPFIEVNKLVRQLIKEGFKTILIQDCNPGHHELAKDIMNTKGVVINYSKYSNYVESGDIDFKNNPEYLYIHEAEESLKEFAKSFDIDYNNDIYLVECCNWYLDGVENGFEPLNEGAIDSLKEFFKKIVAGIVGLIKRIVNFVKAGIQKFIEMFRGTKENPKDVKSETPKEIKTKLIDVNKKGIVEVSGKSREDFEKHSKKTCADISTAIKDINSKQQAGLKDAEKIINSLPAKLETLKLPDKQGSSIALPDKSTDQDNNDSKTNESGNLYESLLSSITRSMVLEFDANGDEKNIPGVSDDDGSDYSFDDNTDANDSDDSNTEDDTTAPDQQNSADDQTTDAGSDEYSFDDTSETQDTENNDTSQDGPDSASSETDDQGGENTSNEDEYNLDDSENASDTEDSTTDDGTQPQDVEDDDSTSDDEYNMDGDNSSSSDLDGEDGNNEDEAQSGLKKIEGELFENLSPKQKEIKIKALKQNFLDLYDRCGDVIDLISDNTPASEEESRIFDFVSKTVTELQNNVHDYLADTFGTKTYIDNDAQFKQYLVILDSVKKILDEFLDIKTDKKEETGKK